MSSNSTRARKERNIQDRVSESLTEGDKAFIAELKRFSDASNSTAGEAGGSVNNSPTSPAGNYLARKGDTMLGPIALSPPLDFTINIDANNTINISPLNENNQYSSNLQLEDVPTSTTLDIIAGATFDGQILILRTFAPNPITISQATLSNGGNIQTPDGIDVILGDLQMVILVFDEALKIEENTGGSWRLLNTFGTGGVTGDASAATLLLPSSQLAGVVDFEFTSESPVGSGITDEGNGIFRLSGGIFQLNSSILILGTDVSMQAKWQTSPVLGFGSPADVGRFSLSISINSTTDDNLSNAPITTAFVDATSADVFVRLLTTDATNSGTIQTLGTWAQIFSIGGGGTGTGGISFPILYPQECITSTGVLEIISISGSTGQNKRVTLDQDFQFSFNSLPSDTLLEEIWITFLQDGTGNHNITGFPSNLKNGSQLNVLLDKTANAKTTFHFITEDNGVTFRAELVDLVSGGDVTFPIDFPEEQRGPVGGTTEAIDFTQSDRHAVIMELTGDIGISLINTTAGKLQISSIKLKQDNIGGHAFIGFSQTVANQQAIIDAVDEANGPDEFVVFVVRFLDGLFTAFLEDSNVIVGGGGQNQTPWLSDIDAATFDLRNISNVEFKDASTGPPAAGIFAMFVQSGSLVLNSPVTATGDIDFRIQAANKMVLSATKLEFRDGVDILPTNTNNNDIGATGKVFENVFASNIILETTPTAPAATVFAMFVQDGSLVLNTTSTNEIDFRVAAGNKMILNATSLTLRDDVDILPTNTNKNDLGATGKVFENVFASNIILETTPSVPAAGIFAMFVQSGSLVLNSPVTATGDIDFRIQAANKMVLSATKLEFRDDVDILPITANKNDIGTASLPFENIFVSNVVLTDASPSIPAAGIFSMFVQADSLVLNSGTTDIDFRITAANKMVLTSTALTLRDDVDILVTTVAKNDIGSNGLEFANIFLENLVLDTSSAVPAGSKFAIFVQSDSLVLNSPVTATGDIDFRIQAGNKMVLSAAELKFSTGTNLNVSANFAQFLAIDTPLDTTLDNDEGNVFLDTSSDPPILKIKKKSTSGVVSVVSLEAGAAGGEVNTGANVGTGAGQVFRDKTGVILNFKTLLAGTNITITDNADDITIDATGVSGANQALDNLLNVAINTSLLPASDNAIDLGSASLEWRNIFIDGTANLDTVIIDTLSSVGIINSSLIPSPDNNHDLGTSTFEWKDLFIDGTAHIDILDVDVSSSFTGTATFNDNVTLGSDLNDSLTVNAVAEFNSNVQFDEDVTLGSSSADNITFNGDVVNSITPNVDNTYDLGSSSLEWRNIFIDGTANLDTANIDTLIAGIVTSSLIPSPDNNRTLGTSTFGWADLFLGSGGFVNFDGGTTNSISVVSGTMNLRAVTEFDFDVDNNFKLDIRSSGLVSVDIDPFATNTYDLGCSSLRWREIFSNNVLNVSLSKFKKNITELNDEDCLKVCNSLRTIEYEWKDEFDSTDKNRRYVGFDVDELAKILPNAVKGDMFYPNAVIGVLLGAVRNLEQRITELSS